MAQFKVFGMRKHLEHSRAGISEALHRAAVQSLRIPADKCFQRFFPMEEGDFVFPSDRSERYTIVEVSLMAGRTAEARKALVRAVFDELAEIGIAAQDVEVTLFESEGANWGFRGMHGDEAVLNYSIKV